VQHLFDRAEELWTSPWHNHFYRSRLLATPSCRSSKIH